MRLPLAKPVFCNADATSQGACPGPEPCDIRNCTFCEGTIQDVIRMKLRISQDLRNHGDSPHNPRHDYTALAEDVEGFISQHGLENPTLIGHSM